MKTNQINIYDYFKLLDIGVQTDYSTKTTSSQYDSDLIVKLVTKATST